MGKESFQGDKIAVDEAKGNIITTKAATTQER